MSVEGVRPLPDPGRREKWRAWFDTRFRTPATIYGLLVYASLLLVMSDHEEDVLTCVVEAVSILIVFFIAHLFAHTIADHGEHPLSTAIRDAFAHSSGMLYAAIPATAAMFIAGLSGDDADDASGWAFIVAVITLGVLGWLAYSRSRAPIWARVAGALSTALLGGFVALLEYASH